MATTPTYAKKVLPYFKSTSNSTSTASTTGSVVSKVRFRADRLGIIMSFSNLSQASSVSYALSYVSRGTTQGANGTILDTSTDTERDLIFGTCSHGVCRFDSGITNARLVVTINLKDGRRIVKTFVLRV